MVRGISELFPAVDSQDLNASALLIHAGHDIAGFYTFETSNDDMYFPLLDREDIHRELMQEQPEQPSRSILIIQVLI